MIKKSRVIQALLIIAILLLQIIMPTANSIAVEANLVTIQFKDVNMYNKMVDQLKYEISSKNDTNLTISMTQSDIYGVTEIDLSGNPETKIVDISGIEKFVKLTELDLALNEISNISILSNLTNLTDLDLIGNEISNISVLSNLTNMTSLYLDDNKINNINSLENLTNLTELSLSSNDEISDITSLANLKNLTYLDLSGNKINNDNINILAGLTNLMELSLDVNEISDISPLSELTNLKSLRIGYNEISDVNSLSNLQNLTYLNLFGNEISDVSPLSNLLNLTQLEISCNKISDISQLLNLKNLTNLDMWYQDIKVQNEDMQKEIELPNLFKEAKIESSKIYSSEEYILENCTLNSDVTKIILDDVNKVASVKISNGNASQSRMTILPKGYSGSSENDPEPKTEFVIGRDNNSFTHTNSSDFNSAGFVGVTNYQIPQKYFDAITKNSTDGQKDAVIAREHKGWNGSCYGIAAMMGLAYYNRIDLEDIQEGVTDFFDLDYPYKQEELLNLIQSYYLMQVSGEKIDYQYIKPFLFGLIKDPDNDYDNLNSFLEDLVNTTKQEIVQLGYGTSKGGHEILACGSEQLEDGTYRVKLYDMNSVRDDNSGQFKYMTISSDFSEFNIENALDGKPMNNKNYRYIRFRRFSDYKIITEDNNGLILKSSASQQENELVILFDAVSNFTIKNSKNETLTYNGENLSGSMEVRDINFVANGEDNQDIIVKVPYSEELIYEEQGEQTNISVYDNDNYMSVEGSNIDNAVMDLDEDVKVQGEECKVKVQIDNKNDGLYEINADIQNEVEVKRQSDNIKISSDEKIENVTINELTVEEKNELVNSVEAKNVNIDGNGNVTSYDELLNGDANGDGKVDFKDILAINKHRLGKSQLTGMHLEAADVNGDGKADFRDILQINKYRLGIMNSL